MKTFRIIDSYQGYQNKRDVTNMPTNFLVAPSQNVLINDAEKVSTRKGFTLFGEMGEAENSITSGLDWEMSSGGEQNLRVNDDVLEYLYINDGVPEWRELLDNLPTPLIRGDSWWDNSESIDLLLFVVGNSNIYSWSGAITTFASATDSTITKEGTETWGESRFLTAGTREIVIDGVTYEYTGGEGTTTLTGVTPDPTTAAHDAGAIVHQAVRVEADTPDSGVTNTLLRVLYNQVYVADETKRSVFISNVTDFTDFSLTSPRAPGDPAVLTLDSPPSAFIPQEDAMYISGKKDQWYEIKFTLSDDLLGEQVDVRRLKTGPGQGAISQEAVGHIKNQVAFISSEPTLDTLGRLENIDTPQSKPLSDPVKLDFDTFDFTGADVRYFKNSLFIAVPVEGLVLIYDIERQFWQPPQVLPVSRFMVRDGKLYGHSSAKPVTYELFVGANDNGLPINAIAAFSYRTYGQRFWKKTLNEWATEGSISANCELTLTLNYDFGGFTTNKDFIIRGDDDGLLFEPQQLAGIGKNPFGKNPFGSVLTPVAGLPKFRVINETVPNPFYEIQAIYESYGVDQQWELLSLGGNARFSPHDNIEIKR